MISLEEVKELAKGYERVPIAKEILSDIKTPMQVLRILKKKSRHCYILESVENQERLGRYTFLGYDPKLEITCVNGQAKIKDASGKEEIKELSHPRDLIRKILKEYSSPKVEGLPSFYRWSGGLFFL